MPDALHSFCCCLARSRDSRAHHSPVSCRVHTLYHATVHGGIINGRQQAIITTNWLPFLSAWPLTTALCQQQEQQPSSPEVPRALCGLLAFDSCSSPDSAPLEHSCCWEAVLCTGGAWASLSNVSPEPYLSASAMQQ